MTRMRFRNIVLLGLCLSACSSPASPGPDPDRAVADAAFVADTALVADAAAADLAAPADAKPALDVAAPAACPTGQHTCAGACVSNDDVRTCGTSCAPCATVEGARSTCDGTKCGIECPFGFKLCLDQCVGPDDICSETCGWPPTHPVTCGKTCVVDTPDSCCSQKELCGAYGCRDNQCIHVCATNADCAAGQTCDVATGKCGPCGSKGQFCCWNQAAERYTCDGFDNYCMGMQCVPVPGK